MQSVSQPNGAPVTVNEIIGKLSERGRLEWDLACALAVNEKLEQRVTELEQKTTSTTEATS